MKKILLLILLIASVLGASAQNATPEEQVYTIYFEYNKWGITSNLQRTVLGKALKELRNRPEVTVAVVGWADKTGSYSANRIVSLRRAESVKAYLQRNGIDPDRITVSGDGSDHNAPYNAKARRVDIIMTLSAEPVEPVDPPRQVDTVVIVERVPFAVPMPTLKDNLSIRTNLLYFAGGVPNIGIEFMPTKTVGILVNGCWGPWSSNGWPRNWAAWFVSSELRFYIGRPKRWFTGVQFIMGQYNFKPQNIGIQGDFIAGGITLGHKLPLSKAFEMDFSLGMGYGEFQQDKYRRKDQINLLIKKGITQSGIMPTQAGVSLIWKIQ